MLQLYWEALFSTRVNPGKDDRQIPSEYVLLVVCWWILNLYFLLRCSRVIKLRRDGHRL